MCRPDPLEELRLELHATLAETIAKLRNPTESDVRRVLQALRTGDPELDREIDEYADVLILLALNRPLFPQSPQQARFPVRLPPGPRPDQSQLGRF